MAGGRASTTSTAKRRRRQARLVNGRKPDKFGRRVVRGDAKTAKKRR